MSLEFSCRWSSTVAYKDIFINNLKNWGSFVGGVFLSLELYSRHTVTIAYILSHI
jgi:hypothetical protein